MSKRAKLQADTVIQDEQATVIGLHSVKNMLGHERQLSLFSEYDLESFSKTYGIKIKDEISRFGIDLTDIQACLMEGLLRGFTATKYKGNIEPKETNNFIQEKYTFGQLPSIYKYIKEIPCLRVTQSQILEWAGINKRSFAEKERAIDALKHLGTAQYCFYYERLTLDKNGVAEKDSTGKWKKEEVFTVDTLFSIKEIREAGKLQYYEIIPSPIFLDQKDSYFMLVPYNWREEVRALVGNKKASSYTFRFLIFLRYQYEMRRRNQKDLNQQTTLKWGWEEIAVALKMPESVYKRKKERARKILADAYWVAQQLGYLKDYKHEGELDILVFNEQKYMLNKNSYYQTEEIKKLETQLFSSEAIELFEFFHNEKLQKDPKYKLPIAKTKTTHLADFEKLLKLRSLEDIKRLIKWGLNLKFWCSQLSTPARLRQNFSTAWIEMTNASTKGEGDRLQDNREIVSQFLMSSQYIKQSKVKIELLNSYVEIGYGSQPTCISYKEKGFKEMFENALRKWGLI